MSRELLNVQSLKYDGRVQRVWPAELVRRVGTLLVVEGVFASEVRHPLLGTIRAGTLSTEYYWSDRWYSVFRFNEPDTHVLRNYYCNINTPPLYAGRTLSFVDLDIDVLVAPDFSIRVLDREEYDEHERLYGYPAEFRQRVHEALEEVCDLVRRRVFPFDAEADAPARGLKPRLP